MRRKEKVKEEETLKRKKERNPSKTNHEYHVRIRQ